MENRSRKNQSKQIQVNDYERNRLLRVQENKKRMHDLGLKKISNSLTSLVETQKLKKKKVKPTFNNARDVDYVLDNDEESEEDYIEVDTSAQVSKKKQLGLVDEYDGEDEGIFSDDDRFYTELDGLESSDSEWDIVRKEDGVDQEEDHEDMEDTRMANNENETQMADSNDEMENGGDVQLQSVTPAFRQTLQLAFISIKKQP
ncbi:hypothetical protein QVD17_09039 [Tagetes erecta]|uniref:Uncharacterized protein n=1 Tax=Tagetes erecta TaxID=13708 RepID=A0AAD8L580_TARER|nr:hypothetical protein QVD17_09039 [Tagetes erecta]